MSWLTKLFRREKAVGPTLADTTFFQSLRLKLAMQGISQPYNQHPWVYASARSIAQAVAAVPFRVYDGQPSEDTVVETGPLADLFRDVNPFMSRFQLWEATMIYLEITGECYWVLERGADGIPTEIWPFGPDFIRPKIDKERGVIVGFETTATTPKAMGLDEVIFFRYFNPVNWNRGLSPLEPLDLTINTDHLCSEFQSALFQNGADPGGVLISEDELTEDDINRIKTGWEDRHRGAQKAGKVAVLQGGIKYEPIKISNRDIQFMQQREWHRDEIIAAFKVPKAELSVYESLNFATARIADRGFWQKTLLPKVQYIEDVLRTSLFAKIPGNFIGGFDLGNVSALNEIFKEKMDTAKVMADMGWPINMINKRLQLGMPDVPWGDTAYLPLNVLPATSFGRSKQVETSEAGQKQIKHVDDIERDLRFALVRFIRRAKTIKTCKPEDFGTLVETILSAHCGKVSESNRKLFARSLHGVANSIIASFILAGEQGVSGDAYKLQLSRVDNAAGMIAERMRGFRDAESRSTA